PDKKITSPTLEHPADVWSTATKLHSLLRTTGMTKLPKALLFAASVMAGLLAASVSAFAAAPYVITNDDESFPFTGVSFVTVAPDGTLSLTQQVATAGSGIGGGFFGTNRLLVYNSGGQSCVFASEAATGDISGIDINTLTLSGSATGSQSDAGTGNGIGL